MITHDNQWLFTAGVDLCLKQWSTTDHAQCRNWGQIHKQPITNLVVTMDDRFVFSGSFDKHMKQWDIQRQRLTKGRFFESQKRRLWRDTFEMGGLDANFAQWGKCLYLRL